MVGSGAESQEIQLKGSHYGIKVIFPETFSDEVLLEKFKEIPERNYVFPMGTGLVLDFQNRPCSEDLIAQILFKVVWPKHLSVLAWLSSDEETLQRFHYAGFRTLEPWPEVGDIAGGTDTAILHQSMRSGQCEEFFCNVLLTGHLNSGAEIFAGHSIAVLGRMKGLVHAGRRSTKGVYVIAGSFEPQQVRIGDKLCSQLGEDMKWWKKSVIITLEEDKLFIRELKLRMGNESV